MGTLDDYELGDLLGSGGFADVYRARRIDSGRHVALKKGRADEESQGRIRVEIDVQRTLRHANVLPVLDFDDVDYAWFVTDLAEGSLGKVHYDKRLDSSEVLRVAEEMLGALGLAHRRGLVHRDLSLENILRYRGSWVLADWGYLRDPEATGVRRMTRTGTGGGTMMWAAPETLADAHKVDFRADLFSLGKILAWLLGDGELPGIGTAAAVAPGTPWTAFLTSMTALDVSERPQSAEAALGLLGAVVKALPRVAAAPLPDDADRLGSSPQVATMKRYLTAPQDRIRLHDLLMRETDRACKLLAGPTFDPNLQLAPEAIKLHLAAYAEACSTLMHFIFVGCLHGEEEHAPEWTKCVERIAGARERTSGKTYLLDLQRLAPLLVVYAGALGAVVGRRAYNFTAVTLSPMLVINDERAPVPIVDRVSSAAILSKDLFRAFSPTENRVTPGSDWLFEQLRDIAKEGVVDEKEYDQAFDELEMIMALLLITRRRGWSPARFCWKDRWRARDDENALVERMKRNLTEPGNRWEPFAKVIFETDDARSTAFDALTKYAARDAWR